MTPNDSEVGRGEPLGIHLCRNPSWRRRRRGPSRRTRAIRAGRSGTGQMVPRANAPNIRKEGLADLLGVQGASRASTIANPPGGDPVQPATHKSTRGRGQSRGDRSGMWTRLSGRRLQYNASLCLPRMVIGGLGGGFPFREPTAGLHGRRFSGTSLVHTASTRIVGIVVLSGLGGL
jgi:hypothetical protein